MRIIADSFAALGPLAVPPAYAQWAQGVLYAISSITNERDGGSLDLLLLSQFSPTGLVLTKIFSHWLSTGAPLIIAAPFVALAFDLDYHSMMTMLLSMLLGTPVLSLVGAVGAALTVGVRRGGMLLSLLLLPLYIPVLIFGAGSVEASLFGMGPQAHLIILLALLMLALALAPFAAAAALLLHVRS